MMNEHHNSSHGAASTRSFWKTRAGIVLIAFLAVAGVLLVYEHRIHVFGGNGLLIALLAVCIGMHFFMHGGRHDKDDDAGRDGRP